MRETRGRPRAQWTGRRRGDATRWTDRRGILLPAALFLILVATLVGTALLVLARSAILLGAGDRDLAQALAVRGPAPDALESGAGLGLRAGYRLVDTPAPGASWRVWSLVWQADPAALVDGLRGVVEAGSVEVIVGEAESGPGAESGTGVEPLRALGPGDGCPEHPPLPLVWLHGEAAPAPVSLGPLPLGVWSERAEVLITADSPAPELERTHLFLVEGGSLDAGVFRGLILAPGDLELRGEVLVAGLLLVGGDLRMSGDARVLGAVRVGGSLTVEPAARVEGCPPHVAQELSNIPALDAPFPVPGGRFLGRF